tara:strand:+ start:730 stop:843 length:114 start_codon:yes stop_codon:yes gene_type:complete
VGIWDEDIGVGLDIQYYGGGSPEVRVIAGRVNECVEV